MSETEKKSYVDKLWDFLASVKLAIILFSLIAATSIVGTVIEQQASPEKNLVLLGKLFGESLAPALYDIFATLGFMDMYRSWWFLLLLFSFAANLLICSIDRFPRVWRLAREEIKPLSDEQFKSISFKKEIVMKGKPEKVREQLSLALKSSGFNFSEVKEQKGYQLYSQKGGVSRLGVYITHLSIIIILIGSLAGIFFGFKGQLNLPEGKTFSMIFMRTGFLTNEERAEQNMLFRAIDASGGIALPSELARYLGVDEITIRKKMKRYGIQPLGFNIRCDDFDLSFYEGTDMPKEYMSRLTIVDDGKEVIKKSIVVNDPLRYKGVTFYQSSYGFMPEAHAEFILRLTSIAGASELKKVHIGEEFVIPQTDVAGVIRDYSPALTFDQGGNPSTYANSMNNPAVNIDFAESGKPKTSQWILKRHPHTWSLQNGHKVELVDIWGTQYTGLQVRNDPGVWIVYLGCITMSLGLFTAFFMSHRRIWIKLVEEKSGIRVIFGASSNKNRPSFEKRLDKIIAHIDKGGK